MSRSKKTGWSLANTSFSACASGHREEGCGSPRLARRRRVHRLRDDLRIAGVHGVTEAPEGFLVPGCSRCRHLAPHSCVSCRCNCCQRPSQRRLPPSPAGTRCPLSASSPRGEIIRSGGLDATSAVHRRPSSGRRLDLSCPPAAHVEFERDRRSRANRDPRTPASRPAGRPSRTQSGPPAGYRRRRNRPSAGCSRLRVRACTLAALMTPSHFAGSALISSRPSYRSNRPLTSPCRKRRSGNFTSSAAGQAPSAQ